MRIKIQYDRKFLQTKQDHIYKNIGLKFESHHHTSAMGHIISSSYTCINNITFVCIWQILSNHRLTKFKRFISQITGISYFFYLYLVLHVCAIKFDVTENLKNFAKYFGNCPVETCLYRAWLFGYSSWTVRLQRTCVLQTWVGPWGTVQCYPSDYLSGRVWVMFGVTSWDGITGRWSFVGLSL